MITLRPYQQQAVDAVYEHLRTRDDNPCVVLPTAAGKTPCMATICRDAVNLWNGRVLVLAHVKELLEQSAGTLSRMMAATGGLGFADCVGVYSAGLKRRDTDHPVIVAGIQSAFKRACELGSFDLIVVDECHLLPTDGEGMYRQFLRDAKVVNPNVRLIGFTATPFRMSSGMICGPENLLNHICYEAGVRELIVNGYLCPLKSKAGIARADVSGVHVKGGEFVADELEDAMDGDELVNAACAEIVELTESRNSVLIFAAGVNHAMHIQRTLADGHGVECGFVCGKTTAKERDELLGRFRAGDLKYLVNVNVLTTGFDAPNIDCVAMLRPTMSPGLYYQCVGRGFRLHPDKTNCLVLDFAGNILRHGPVDALRISDLEKGSGDAPAKECPQCHALIHASYSICPDCGHQFPPPERQSHQAKASTAGILSDQQSIEEFKVIETFYSVHEKRNAPPDHPKTMRVEYRIGFSRYVSEWICIEHTGYAQAKAQGWWRARSNDPFPNSAEEAVEMACAGSLAPSLFVKVRTGTGSKYDEVVGHLLGQKPPAIFGGDLSQPPPEYCQIEDEVPF